MSANPELGLVIVHGAGSYGHFDARQYNIKHGGTVDGQWREGFCRTRASVLKLNGLVVGALIRARVAAVSVEMFPHTCATRDGRITAGTDGGLALTEGLLERGLVPVLHGDAVLTSHAADATCTILSGDVLVRDLCTRLGHVQAAVFLTDVAGAYTTNPRSIRY